MSELQSGMKLPPTQLFVTANSQKGFISMDGRSEKSRFWAGGASYVVMCVKCGLEPSRQGSGSNCFCMCDACAAPLNGLGSFRTSSDDVNPGKAQIVCKRCGGQGNSVVPICTREVRAKRSRDSYAPWHKKPTTAPFLQTPSSGAAIATVATTDNAVQGAASVAPVETSKVLAADQSVAQNEISFTNLRSVTSVVDDNPEDRETKSRGENIEDNHAKQPNPPLSLRAQAL
jgi:hypothetical protein